MHLLKAEVGFRFVFCFLALAKTFIFSALSTSTRWHINDLWQRKNRKQFCTHNWISWFKVSRHSSKERLTINNRSRVTYVGTFLECKSVASASYCSCMSKTGGGIIRLCHSLQLTFVSCSLLVGHFTVQILKGHAYVSFFLSFFFQKITTDYVAQAQLYPKWGRVAQKERRREKTMSSFNSGVNLKSRTFSTFSLSYRVSWGHTVLKTLRAKTTEKETWLKYAHTYLWNTHRMDRSTLTWCITGENWTSCKSSVR